MKGYRKYFGKKILWLVITFIAALLLNFILPRLMPGDPVAAMTAKQAKGLSEASAVKAIYDNYAREFGTNKPITEQFFTYVGNLAHGDMGTSFSQYPRKVSDIISDAILWTICLQFPAIIIGWFLGNLLGALAAYIAGFDKVLMPLPVFQQYPASAWRYPAGGFLHQPEGRPLYGGNGWKCCPISDEFCLSVIQHYQLPFWSIVLVSIGGQAVGMRSMSIYELNADYVKYARFLGIKDKKVVGYVFRNAMLPQVTGLALSIGTMVGGALVAEIIFSYPGLGTTIYQGIAMADYPLISGATLIITIMVLIATFVLDIIYGFIDPRVKAAQFE